MRFKFQEGGTCTVSVRSEYTKFDYISVCAERNALEPRGGVRLNVQESDGDQVSVVMSPEDATELASYLQSRAAIAMDLIEEAEEENK